MSSGIRQTVKVTVFKRDGCMQLSLGALNAFTVGEDELLWLDFQGKDRDREQCLAIADCLGLPPALLPKSPVGSHPEVNKAGEWISVRAISASVRPGLEFAGQVLVMIAGKNIVVSLHEEPVEGIDRLIEHSHTNTGVGRLGHGSFLAAILDWQLSTYFEAAAAFEIEIERLENAILSRSPPEEGYVPSLQHLRRAASRLRRMLAPHRLVFSTLSRPDFTADGDDLEARHYHALDGRFAAAMDVVENARELVMGSFQLFSSQTDLQTNAVMRLLTFTTVVTGVFAVIAGVLGMNFEVDFFKSASGFWIALGGMGLVAVVAFILGKRGKWF